MATTTTITEHTVSNEESIPYRPRALGRVSQFIDYAFWLLYSLLFIRLLLVFFHAASWAGFVRFIDTITNPFYAPFRGIVASQELQGGFTLAIPILIALVAYAILHLAINKLLRVIAYRRTTV
ncbi:MAG: YggT family protein [Gemmatimonadales bacterium]